MYNTICSSLIRVRLELDLGFPFHLRASGGPPSQSKSSSSANRRPYSPSHLVPPSPCLFASFVVQSLNKSLVRQPIFLTNFGLLSVLSNVFVGAFCFCRHFFRFSVHFHFFSPRGLISLLETVFGDLFLQVFYDFCALMS